MNTGYDKYLEFQYRWTGDFYTTLFQAISLADTDNTARLAEGFPEEVDAYLIWTRQGADALLEKISLDHPLRERFIKEYGLEENKNV